MEIYTTLHRQLLVAILASSVVVLSFGASAAGWRPLPDELINRPTGPTLCEYDPAACEQRAGR
jgi:hypothetical protein